MISSATTSSALQEAAFGVARAAVDAQPALAREAFEALDERAAGLLLDGGKTLAGALELLRAHAAEALVAERVVLRAGAGAGDAEALLAALRAPGDPAGQVLARLERRALARAEAALDRALACVGAPPGGDGADGADGSRGAAGVDWAEDLFARSFSVRARKRRGGVYTGRELVDILLDLAGWTGAGRLLEPAAGAGAFLVRAWERALAAGHCPRRLAGDLLGVDVHPFACRAARTALALTAARLHLPASALPRVVQADALLAPAPHEGGGPGALAAGSFGFVVGNPPYVRGERVPAELRRRYRALAPELGQGNVDLSAYFVRRALDLLEPGGQVVFVLTQGLLEAASSAGLRAHLATRTIRAVVSLEWAPALFPGAAVIPCLLVVQNAPPPPRHEVALGRGACEAGRLVLRWSRLAQEDWLDVARGRWALHVRRDDLAFLRRLERAPTPLVAGYGLALRSGGRPGVAGGAPALIAPGPAPASFVRPRPLLDGREVRAWRIESTGRVIDYRPEAISDPKSEEFFRAPKVLLPRIALCPQAAVDEGDPAPFFARNTVMVVRAPDTALAARPHALAAAINSLPLRSYAFHALRAGVLAASHRATFYARIVADFPLPAALLEDGRLVERLEQLGRDAQAAAREGQHEELRAIEARIDARVARAFGLDRAARAALRASAGEEPLRTVLRPAALGRRARRIRAQAYAAGERYR